ncbi:MAG: glycosyltransferase [Candidatus Eisenbacteria bacterium]|nr:glycosyltransferase [Candidatus Eisenbacteria bacterium]
MRNLAILEALAPRFELEILTLVHRKSRFADPGPVARLGAWRGVLAPNRRSLLHRAAGQIDYRLRGRGWERETWFLGCRALARAVSRSIAEHPPDLVHVAYWYTLRHLAPFSRPSLWVLDTHDVQFERWERIRHRPSPRERDAEIAEWRRYDRIVAITPRDADTIRAALGTAEPPISTIGMGVDLDRFRRGDALAAAVTTAEAPTTADAPTTPEPAGGEVVYFGNLGTPGNRDAAVHLCHDILPRIRQSLPEARVLLAGADPAPDVRALGAIPGVRVTGAVEDPRPYLARAAVFALCLRAASGIRSRACEAMALELPIVAYPEALEGMGFRLSLIHI